LSGSWSAECPVLAGLSRWPGSRSTDRYLLESGSFRTGITASEQLIERVESKPWLRKLWWLQGAVYTRDPVAMALNNVVAANLELRQLDDAKQAFAKAISPDSDYAVPHFNFAMIASLEKDDTEEEHRLERPAALGYSQSAIDNFLKNAGSILARFEGASGG